MLTVLLRVAWRTVAAVVTRVVADGRATDDLLAGLSRIGIDEIAYRRRHRYLLVTWNHDTGPAVLDRHHDLRDTYRHADDDGAEVAGVRAAPTGGRVAPSVGRSRARTAHDRRVCAGAGGIPALV